MQSVIRSTRPRSPQPECSDRFLNNLSRHCPKIERAQLLTSHSLISPGALAPHAPYNTTVWWKRVMQASFKDSYCWFCGRAAFHMSSIFLPKLEDSKIMCIGLTRAPMFLLYVCTILEPSLPFGRHFSQESFPTSAPLCHREPVSSKKAFSQKQALRVQEHPNTIQTIPETVINSSYRHPKNTRGV